MNTELNFDENPSPIVGPGSRLRIAREEIGLTIPQVSSYLHLTSQLIRDIENDDYSRAPQAVFMRGYLRSYAKLVDLAGDEIVAAFNALQQSTTFTNPQSISLNYESDILPKKRGGMIYFLVLLPALIIAVWFSPLPLLIKMAVQQKLLPQMFTQSATEKNPQEEKPQQQAELEKTPAAETLTSQIFDQSRGS